MVCVLNHLLFIYPSISLHRDHILSLFNSSNISRIKLFVQKKKKYYLFLFIWGYHNVRVFRLKTTTYLNPPRVPMIKTGFRLYTIVKPNCFPSFNRWHQRNCIRISSLNFMLLLLVFYRFQNWNENLECRYAGWTIQCGVKSMAKV